MGNTKQNNEMKSSLFTYHTMLYVIQIRNLILVDICIGKINLIMLQFKCHEMYIASFPCLDLEFLKKMF